MKVMKNLPPPDRTMWQYGKQVDLYTAEQVMAEIDRLNGHAVILAETARQVERERWFTAARLCVEATPDQLPLALDALRDVLVD